MPARRGRINEFACFHQKRQGGATDFIPAGARREPVNRANVGVPAIGWEAKRLREIGGRRALANGSSAAALSAGEFDPLRKLVKASQTIGARTRRRAINQHGAPTGCAGALEVVFRVVADHQDGARRKRQDLLDGREKRGVWLASA